MTSDCSDTKQKDEETPPPLWRQLSAEAVGTFVLTFAAAGADITDALSGGAVGHVARYLAPAIAVMAMIWSFSGISGAHLNPAVSWAFFVRGIFPGRMLAPYVGSQLAGAIAASLLLRVMFGPAIARGITEPTQAFSPATASLTEIVLSFFLVLVILGTASQKAVVGKNTALAVGGVVALCGLGFSPLSGASMNPARTLGPMVAAGDLHLAWLYIVAPLVGASIAAGVVWLLYGTPDADARESAQGI